MSTKEDEPSLVRCEPNFFKTAPEAKAELTIGITRTSTANRHLFEQNSLRSFASIASDGVGVALLALCSQSSTRSLADALSKHCAFTYDDNLPEILEPSVEFRRLCRYLGMSSDAATGWAQLHERPLHLMVTMIATHVASTVVYGITFLVIDKPSTFLWTLPASIFVSSGIAAELGFWR
jgi:hypothetical protein